MELMQKTESALDVGNFSAGTVQDHFWETKSKSTPWAERKDRLFPLKLWIICRAALHLSQQTKTSSSLKGTGGIYARQWIMCFVLSQSLEFTSIEIPNKSALISVGNWRDLHLAVSFCIAPFPFFQSINQLEDQNYFSKVKDLKWYK